MIENKGILVVQNNCTLHTPNAIIFPIQSKHRTINTPNLFHNLTFHFDTSPIHQNIKFKPYNYSTNEIKLTQIQPTRQNMEIQTICGTISIITISITIILLAFKNKICINQTTESQDTPQVTPNYRRGRHVHWKDEIQTAL